MYLEELYLLQMQNNTQLSVTEARISVISRGDFYALLDTLGSAKRDMTCTFTRMSNLKAKVWLSLGIVMAMENFCAEDCKNMRVLENASIVNVFLSFFHQKDDSLISWLLS